MLAALLRLRRAPLAAARARRANRADGRAGRIPPPAPGRREVGTVILIPSGPGRWPYLADTIESVLASDGDASRIVVVDDATVDTRESVIRERFPQVDVVRKPVPSCGPPATWPVYRFGLLHALERYAFERLIKMDSDALVTGPRLSETTAARISGTGRVGLAGWYGICCDGAPANTTYHAALLRRELRYDRTLRAAVERAEEYGWQRGELVHGGTQCLTRAAADAVAAAGWLGWRRPWHSQTSDDLVLTVFVRACGYELLSIGEPDGIYAIGNRHLPLRKEEVAGGPWVAAHSTNLGLEGEAETDLRAFFRERRAAWPPP